MFIEVKTQPFTKLGYLACAQTSTCRSAGEKSCTFLAFRTSKFFLSFFFFKCILQRIKGKLLLPTLSSRPILVIL